MYREIGEELTGRSRIAIVCSIVAALIGLPLGALLWMTSVPGQSYDGPPPRLSVVGRAMASRLRMHVVAVASVPHNIDHPVAYAGVQRYIVSQMTGIGYRVDRQAVVKGADNLSVNIGSADPKAGLLIVGAHYDSAGAAPGANDNGSGVAALIELARALKPFDGKLSSRVRLIWFANEEPPYFQREAMGSLVAARSIAASHEHVIGMIALETIGYFSDRPNSQHYPFPLSLRYPDRGNFIAFVGMTSSRGFVRRSIRAFRLSARIPSVGGVAPSFVQGMDWSDHWSFEQQDIPAFMITDTAPFRYPYYHEATDTPDKVDYDRLALVVEGLDRMVLRLAPNDQ